MANENEGADPTDDIKKQNPDEKVAGDGDDQSSTKAQDLTTHDGSILQTPRNSS